MIELAKFGELCLGEQLAQFAALCTNRVGMVLADFNRYVLELGSGLYNEAYDWNSHDVLY